MNTARGVSILFSALALGLMLPTTGSAKMHQQTIDYHQGGATLSGYLAYDDSFPGLRPAVLVFHHYMGIDDYIRGRTDQLARMGYVAFAGDVYGKGVRPANATEAAALSTSYRNNRPLTTCSLTAAGRKAFTQYVNLLEQIVQQTKPK